MKVIKTSNYDIESFIEEQVSPPGLSKKRCEDLAEELNRPLSGESTIWHLVVDDEYVLCDGEP